MDNNDFELKEDNPIKLNPRFRPNFGDEDKETSKMSSWIINHSLGVIKTEKQATGALVAFTILSFIISLFLIFGGENQNKQTYTPAADALVEDLIPNRQ